MASTTPTYARATDHVKGIGESLETIQNRDVLLRTFSISERSMRGDKKTFVSMQISELDNLDVVKDCHAWSESLADKLAEIPDSALPVVINFTRVATSGGFRVWTFI